MSLKILLVSIVLINFIFIPDVYAYIDPNTGGFFFQTVAPFVYGLLGLIVVFWKRITEFAKGLFGSKKDLDDSSKDS